MKLFWDIVAWIMYFSATLSLLGCGYMVSFDLLNIKNRVPAKVDKFITRLFGASYGICSVAVVMMMVWAIFVKK